MKTIVGAGAVSLVLAVSGTASAGIITEATSGFAITGGTNSSDIYLDPAVYGELDNLQVQVGLNTLSHTWLGDLIVTLTHVESGTTASLFGTVGGGAFGSPAQLNGFYTFNDGVYNSGNPAQGNLWQAASDAGFGGTVASGFFYATNNLSSAYASLNAAFAGVTSAGTWRLTIIDTYASLDDGVLGKWTISLTGTEVPAPGALALLGLAGLAGSRRRRG